MRPLRTGSFLCAAVVLSLAACSSSPQGDGGDVGSDLGAIDATDAIDATVVSDASDAVDTTLDTSIDTPVTNDEGTDVAPTDAAADGFTPTLTSRISGAGASACLIRGAGDVVCWGRVAELITDGGMPSGGIATVPGITDAVELAVGNDYACARSASGTVQCWGNNRSGMLGDGTMTDRASPAPVAGLTDAIGISTMSVTVCALRSTGHVVCWGENGAGQLGRGATSTPDPTPGEVVGLTDIVQVSTGEFSSCALHRDGTVSCWGRNYAGALGAGAATLETCGDPSTPDACSTRPVAVEGITDAVQVSTGLNSACALRATGEVRCWGWNYNGQLGDGTTDDHSTPVAVTGISDATLVRSFYGRKCVVRAGGQPWCWGTVPVGDGTTMSRSTPVAVGGVSDAVDLSGGFSNTCALERGGRIACWGQGYAGVLDRMDGGGFYVTATTLTGL